MFSRTRFLLPPLTSNKTPNPASHFSIFSSSSSSSSSSPHPNQITTSNPQQNINNKDKLILQRFHHKDWLTSKEATTLTNSLTNPSLSLTIFHLYSSRKDYNPTQPFCISLITKFTQSHNFTYIDTLLKTLPKPYSFTEDFFFNLIKIYAHKANRIDKAIQLLNEMPNYGMWPSIKTFNFVLNVLVNAKLYDVVFDLYASALKLGVEIDACCLNIMIKGLCKKGELESAFKVFDEFPKMGLKRNERTFATIMNGLCELESAFKVFDEFPKMGLKRNERTFATIMNGLCEKGMVDEGFGLLERMKEEGIVVDVVVYNVLIHGLVKNGRVDEGVRVLEDVMMRNGCYPNESSYQHVLYGLIDLKRFVEAKGVVEKMVLKGFVVSYDSFKGLVLGFCREGLVEDVDWGVRSMVRMGFVPRMGMWRPIVRCIVVSRDVSVSFDKILDSVNN